VSRYVDVDEASWAVLEVEDLLDDVAARARTEPGRERVRGLRPLARAAEVAAEVALVAEASELLDERGGLVPGGVPDPRAALATLGIEGVALEVATLGDLGAFALAATDVGHDLRAPAGRARPRLAALAAQLPDVRAEALHVLGALEPDGTVRDDASPELGRIRRARRRVAERLQHMLEARLSARDAETVIRDAFVTQRNGRYVIPVRSDAPRPVRGIVHATSSSGATRFVEPLESVELNNELVRLGEDETREVDRLRLVWTEAFRRRRHELEAALDALAGLDAIAARAAWGRERGGVLAAVEPDGPLVLRAVRHPLLDRHLAAVGAAPVPLDVVLDPADRVLVLSGPNAGGKTIALKTFGLAAVMAQCAIPVPADEVRVPPYRRLRADIGDRQSIQADLSTFSAHVRALAEALREPDPPALFLFDEIGTGTEPDEGAALAQAVLESVQRPGLTAAATTHHAAVKAWAVTAPGALSAAMEFDAERLAPTYRLRPGEAGVSAGLDIALRMGLDPDIVERARGRLDVRARAGDEYLRTLRERIDEQERRIEEIGRRERAFEAERRRFAEERARDDADRRERAAAAAERALAAVRRRGEALLDELRDRRERERAARRLDRDTGAAREEARRIVAEALPGGEAAGPVPERIEAGMPVHVVSLGRAGTVREVRGERVEVVLGRVPFVVDRADLRAAPHGPAEVARSPERAPEPGPGDDTEPPRELMLIGRRTEEATAELDRFLDAAALAGLGEVRVVHGHGTGRLRRAVRAFLERHPHVGSQRPGRPYEGGDGATVVTLR